MSDVVRVTVPDRPMVPVRMTDSGWRENARPARAGDRIEVAGTWLTLTYDPEPIDGFRYNGWLLVGTATAGEGDDG